jgi:hypothetical protein
MLERRGVYKVLVGKPVGRSALGRFRPLYQRGSQEKDFREI